MARWAAVLALAAATAIAVASVAGGDMSADKTECADQLVGLAPCLQYVQGQARAPPPDCCGGLRQVLGKSPKCLCVLVKDKDDPNLGIKINATLALALPNACGATRANVSHCARTSSLSSSFSRPASASEATRPPPGPGVAFLTASFFSPQAKSCLCHFILFYFIFAAELLHIPPGSKDAAVFSPGGDKGSTAAPGQPASLPPLPPRCSSFI
jgi:hypothetical protein|uniref:Bifunctional inhibitor/plant lipid transfer protein/seed storage helical domain-containing protein n=1 Tax=Zea mays TaxID=4577 RepID=B4FHY4_MAIZE|nr:unknown [Zea mays]